MTDTGVDYTIFSYTYSTIGQALDSGFGFLQAGTLYQLQSLEAFMSANADRFESLMILSRMKNPTMISGMPREGWEEYVAASRETLAAARENARILMQQLTKAEEHRMDAMTAPAFASSNLALVIGGHILMVSIRRSIKLSAVSTILTVVASLILMPLSNARTMPSMPSACGFLAITIAGAIYSLGMYGKLIFEMASDYHSKTKYHDIVAELEGDYVSSEKKTRGRREQSVALDLKR